MLIIQNPYFLPHRDAIEELKAAVKRGVDVRIMLPAASVIDLPSVQHASHHHYGDLLENGVRIYEYKRTLLHSKVMIVDRTNFDDRSFQLNDEVTVGFTSPTLANQLYDAYRDDLGPRVSRFSAYGSGHAGSQFTERSIGVGWAAGGAPAASPARARRAGFFEEPRQAKWSAIAAENRLFGPASPAPHVQRNFSLSPPRVSCGSPARGRRRR